MTECISKKNEGNCRDRLIELPDEILVHILTFLPLRDAVRTVLLRRFGKLWTLLPTLTFDYCLSNKYISNVMRYHKNPTIDMLKFEELSLTYKEPIDKYLNKWTNFALRKKTKELVVILEPGPSRYFVSPRVFSNQCLVRLNLCGLDIKLPRRVFMGSLQKLVLSFVNISDDTLKKLISGCPCLKELIVRYPYGLEQLHFTAPNIERLYLDFSAELESSAEDRYYSLDCPNLKILHVEDVLIGNLKVIDVSSVIEANIWCSPMSIDDHYDSFVDDYYEPLLKKFQNAQFFQLRHKTYLLIDHCGNETMASQKNKWTHLALKSGIHGGCLLHICRLLRNSPYLTELVLYANVVFSCDCNMLQLELSLPCMMQQLKTVSIQNYDKPCQALLQLIEFLLKSAVVLDKLVIECSRKDQLSSTNGTEFILQLLSFPRASRNARVIFV